MGSVFGARRAERATLLFVLFAALPGIGEAGDTEGYASLIGLDRVIVSGDFRVRYEYTSGYSGRPQQSRGVTRGRLGAVYNVNDDVRLGARLVTGDPDNPRTTDVEIGEFVEDLEVSLDQLYVSFNRGNLKVTAGKMPNPFATTELVWDGDVNPFGIATRLEALNWAGAEVSLTAMYSIVDQLLEGEDSNMAGVQASFTAQPSEDVTIALRAAYYDYTIGSLVNVNPSNIRGNEMTPDGFEFASDFDLVDFIAQIDFAGTRRKWPVRITFDYVQNLGAVIPEDSGSSIELLAGTVNHPGDWRFLLGYATSQKDSVFGVFSNDNTTYSTNYYQQTIAVDYALLEHTYLNLTAYRYKRRDIELTNQPGGNDFVTRMRLNLYVQF